MKELIAVAGGGAIGTVARYLVYVLVGQLFGAGFPFGTLIVNIAGSFLMGALIEAMALAWTVSQEARLFLIVGILGGFTTFSTFSLDVAVLYERGRPVLVAAYVAGSLICSVGALFAGLYAVRRVLGPAL